MPRQTINHIWVKNNSFSHVQFCAALWTTQQSARPLCLWNIPGKNAEVGCHALLQGSWRPGIWSTSLRLLHWQAGSLPWLLPGKPQWMCMCFRNIYLTHAFLESYFRRIGSAKQKNKSRQINMWICEIEGQAQKNVKRNFKDDIYTRK